MNDALEYRRRDTDRFYALLDELAERVGGPRLLRDCTEAGGWPQYGVEFFLKDGQVRTGRDGLRVGSALLQVGDWPTEVAQSWGQQKVNPVQRKAERPLERAVSDHITVMPLLWLSVPNREWRKSIRANSRRARRERARHIGQVPQETLGGQRGPRSRTRGRPSARRLGVGGGVQHCMIAGCFPIHHG
ncbi:hypothetical protein [Actinomadura alba]|uniref:GIY-YIG domain-containing protein n=1 Tax=Actinomadura alba TaxID=406431 RepID=A0ABR7LKL6_9ACTN|nr:hypothetical protein [Actinomadura alba]MBC6465285.1 hypothetical protein [Actinomadura alba]